ncbi:MAG TPA: hypothetical protein VFP59_08700 [Candidatus Angelobacter sp.]|nr:hypothetical protein [Candidatus Angelobacter sp.]
MSRAFSFIALLAVLVVGAWFYMHQAQHVMSAGTSNPTAAVDLTGVRSDLLAMAQAERSHAAMNGSYVSLDDLRSNGDLTMTRDHRGPYTYSAEVSGDGFRIAATYSGPENSGMPKSLSIDQTMEISQQ